MKKQASFSQVVPSGEESLVKAYFSHICKAKPDVLSMEDMVEMTGLSKKTLHSIIKGGYLKHISNGRKFLFPKVYLLEFVASQRFINIVSNSEKFIEIFNDFQVWRQKR